MLNSSFLLSIFQCKNLVELMPQLPPVVIVECGFSPPLILFNIQIVSFWPMGTPSCCLLDFNITPFISESFLTFWYQCSRFVFYISCRRPGTRHSFQEHWCLLVRIGSQESQSGTEVSVAPGKSLLLGLDKGQSQEVGVFEKKQIMS